MNVLTECIKPDFSPDGSGNPVIAKTKLQL